MKSQNYLLVCCTTAALPVTAYQLTRRSIETHMAMCTSSTLLGGGAANIYLAVKMVAKTEAVAAYMASSENENEKLCFRNINVIIIVSMRNLSTEENQCFLSLNTSFSLLDVSFFFSRSGILFSSTLTLPDYFENHTFCRMNFPRKHLAPTNCHQTSDRYIHFEFTAFRSEMSLSVM
jgi:hypothetical protein